jgi:type IX secretion system PorP/SprF family membrane protein
MRNNIKLSKIVDFLNRMKSHLALTSLIFFGFYQSHGQVESMYSLYRFNPQVISPANAGSTENSEITVMNRQQWIGIEGAPKTIGLTMNLKWGEQKGIGVNVISDQFGPVATTAISADFAYHTNLNSNWRMSGGIRAGVSNMSINYSGIRIVTPTDVVFTGDRSTGFQPNLGWGLRFDKGDQFFVSISQPRILKYDFGSQNTAYKDVPYYYSMLGTRLKISDQIIIYPSMMFRMAKDVPLSWDINLTARLLSKLDAGISYRNQDSYGFRLGLQATKKIYVGYVYEMPISQISKVSNQTHELALRFFILKDKNNKEEKQAKSK